MLEKNSNTFHRSYISVIGKMHTLMYSYTLVQVNIVTR